MQFNANKILSSIISLLTLIVLLFGLSYFGMGRHLTTQVIGCPFTPGNNAICQMTPMEHIQAWESMFTTLPSDVNFSLLSIIASFLVLLSLVNFRKNYLPSNLHLARYRISYVSNLSIPDPLKESFSRGILNSKVF